MNPRGALYVLINCPWMTVCHRGLVQFFLFISVWSFAGSDVIVLFDIDRLSIGCCVLSIFPLELNSAHECTGAVGCIYSLITF
jgi:hypothetical protein